MNECRGIAACSSFVFHKMYSYSYAVINKVCSFERVGEKMEREGVGGRERGNE